MENENPNPFSNIALCLSGGGYRAAAFHLGVFSYLNRTGIIKNVKILSTVSGGTLAGMAYAHSLKKKETFEDFYRFFYGFLSTTNLIQLGLDGIGKTADTALGFKNLITSFADVYNKNLFSGERFGIFWNDTGIHLNEIIFNSTEFSTGIDFRFQKSASIRAKIGNGNIEIPVDTAKDIRLADIAAASSCFPGGFEPIAFPDDFYWTDNKIPETLKTEFTQPLALMDGGIYDNQGIDAALLAVKRSKDNSGLFIISDTDQNKKDFFKYTSKKKKSRLTFNGINLLSIALIIISLFSSAGLIAGAFIPGIKSIGLIKTLLFYGFPAAVLIFISAGLLWLRSKIKNEVFDRIPKIKLASWNDFKKLTVDQLIDMAELRITSMFALASTVFMKRIRSLVFEHVYGNEDYEKVRVSNLIYELTGEKKYRAEFLHPSDVMKKITISAASFPTTLWFEKDSDLQNLVACGQYTICYNLIDYILRTFDIEPENYPTDILDIYKRLISDWTKFKANPMFLVTEKIS